MFLENSNSNYRLFNRGVEDLVYAYIAYFFFLYIFLIIIICSLRQTRSAGWRCFVSLRGVTVIPSHFNAHVMRTCIATQGIHCGLPIVVRHTVAPHFDGIGCGVDFHARRRTRIILDAGCDVRTAERVFRQTVDRPIGSHRRRRDFFGAGNRRHNTTFGRRRRQRFGQCRTLLQYGPTSTRITSDMPEKTVYIYIR